MKKLELREIADLGKARFPASFALACGKSGVMWAIDAHLFELHALPLLSERGRIAAHTLADERIGLLGLPVPDGEPRARLLELRAEAPRLWVSFEQEGARPNVLRAFDVEGSTKRVGFVALDGEADAAHDIMAHPTSADIVAVLVSCGQDGSWLHVVERSIAGLVMRARLELPEPSRLLAMRERDCVLVSDDGLTRRALDTGRALHQGTWPAPWGHKMFYGGIWRDEVVVVLGDEGDETAIATFDPDTLACKGVERIELAGEWFHSTHVVYPNMVVVVSQRPGTEDHRGRVLERHERRERQEGIAFDEESFTLIVGAGRAKVPYPSGGFGGYEIVVSPKGRFVAVFLYTGQSEHGYELFVTMPDLRHLGGLPQVVGEGYAPVFSDDERWIAHASAINPSLDGSGVVTWAELRVQDLETRAITTCRIDVNLSTPPAELESRIAYVESLRFTPEGDVTFIAPWGARAKVSLPLPESIVILGPSEDPLRDVLTWEQAKHGKPASLLRYSAAHTFKAGDWIEHPKLGAGLIVEVVEDRKVRTLFEAGEKLLVHSRG